MGFGDDCSQTSSYNRTFWHCFRHHFFYLIKFRIVNTNKAWLAKLCHMFWTVFADFLALRSLSPKPLLFPKFLCLGSSYRLEQHILRLLCLLVNSCLCSEHVPLFCFIGIFLFLDHFLMGLITHDNFFTFLFTTSFLVKCFLYFSCFFANACQYNLISYVIFHTLTKITCSKLLHIQSFKSLNFDISII